MLELRDRQPTGYRRLGEEAGGEEPPPLSDDEEAHFSPATPLYQDDGDGTLSLGTRLSTTSSLRRRASILAAICAVAACIVVGAILGSSPSTAPVARNSQLMQRGVVSKLKEGKQVKLGIIGGSISAMTDNYGNHLIEWMNRNWPTSDGSQHEVINMAIPGSESGVSSICLGTFFRYDPYKDAVPPIDLLLIEFAYNDNGILPGSEGQTDLSISRTANYERIFRTALAWPIPSIVVELVSYSGDARKPPLKNAFLSSSGYSHGLVAQHYSVPIVDVAQTFYSWPHTDDIKGFYIDKGIHLSQTGHIMTASLIARELIYQLSVGTNSSSSVIDLSKVHPSNSGPSWPHLAAWTANHFERPPIVPDPDAQLSPLPHPRWQLGATPLWNCLSSQIEHTKADLERAAVVNSGWEMMIDQSDGGRTRSVSRPGFTVNATDAHLAYDLGKMGASGPTALLYRRSWQTSADALVWLDQDQAASGATVRNGASCPSEPVRLHGTWSTPTTQMVLDEICSGAGGWTARADPNKPTYLHMVTVQPDDDEHRSGTYFKSYGFAASE